MPSDHWIRRVNAVMDHVRAAPADAHTVESLSAVAHSSPFHFHRIFRAVTGETVASFVRRSRLERAAYLMKSSRSRTLSSIALDVGFTSSQEFSRSFRREYGVAPSRWDRRSRLAQPAGRHPSRASPPPPAPTEIVERGAVRLAYVRIRTAFDVGDLSAGFDGLTAYLGERGVPWPEARVVGMSWDNYETTPLDRLHYDLGVEVPDSFGAGGDVGIRTLSAMRAVEVRCEGSLREVAHAWDYLYETWLPDSSFEPADMPAMKWFHDPAGAIRWDRWRVSCSIGLRAQRP